MAILACGSFIIVGRTRDTPMNVSILAAGIQATWLIIEWHRGCITIEKPWQQRPVRNWDRHSSTVWDVANAIEPVGLVLGFLGVGRFVAHRNFISLVGFALLLMGIAIRWAAIRRLGKLFTGVVTIQRDHQLVRDGLYRYVRHPSYTGALIAHLGLGLSFVSWVSLALSTIPFVVAATYRIHVEEQALRQAFGDEYATYSEETWRLIPCVY
jgi:protein-S-isoprenylcysteine O-methyltransferase Ste14